MTITNGYCTLSEYKAYANITTTNATDDTVIEQLIEKASRMIDGITGQTFYARTETHLFDTPDDRTLWIDDDDLLTATKITNGDGTEITSANYILEPANASPKWAVTLKGSSSIWWQPDSSGNTEQVISIAGTWGYSSTAPADIKAVCMEIARNEYGKRNGDNTAATANITAAGVVITPQGLPVGVRDVLNHYRKLT